MPDVVAGVAVAPTKQTKDDSIHLRRAIRASERLRNPRDVIDMVRGSGQLRQARSRREIVIRFVGVDAEGDFSRQPQHVLDSLRRFSVAAEMGDEGAGLTAIVRWEKAWN